MVATATTTEAIAAVLHLGVGLFNFYDFHSVNLFYIFPYSVTGFSGDAILIRSSLRFPCGLS